MPFEPTATEAAASARGDRRLSAMVAALTLLLAIDAVPCVPPRLRAAVAPLVRAFGLNQTHWELFAPEPEAQNYRLEAKLHFADGSIDCWQSPAWREKSTAWRFWNHRLCEYLDQIRDPRNEAAWPALADYVVRRRQDEAPRTDRPVRVELFVQSGLIHDPRLHPWPSRTEPARLDDRRTLYTRDYR